MKIFNFLKIFQEGKRLHLECEIEALPRPEIFWYLGESRLEEGEKYSFYRAIQPSNPNIHFVRLTINVSKSLQKSSENKEILLTGAILW